MILSIIVAMDQRGGIGIHNRLPWHLPADLRRFKQLTMGHALILGRKTYQSIGKPLVGRRMIVLSRQSNLETPHEVMVVSNFEAALDICRQEGEEEAFVAGGAEVFKVALPLAQKLYLTRILAVVESDTFFPKWDESEWKVVSYIKHPADDRHPYSFCFIDYQRQSLS